MNTHKAVNTITTAPMPKDAAAIERLHKPGARVEDVKTLNPGDHFDPAEHGFTPEEVAKLEASGKIAKLDGAQEKPKPEVVERGNRTEGSGATGLGTKADSPPGVDRTGKAGPQQAGGVGSNLPPKA